MKDNRELERNCAEGTLDQSPKVSGRVSRRSFLTGLASVSAMAAASACVAPALPTLESPAPTAVQAAGGSRAATFILPVNGDPFRWPFAPAIPNILFNKTVYSSLIKYDLDGVTPVPDLAESWTSDDAQVWTFKLRQDVKWHDGEPFTAEDVKFTFDAMIDPKVNKTNIGVLGNLETTEVLDAYTVRLTFPEPIASLPVGLGWLIFILPKHLLENADLNNPTDFLKNPIGTGAFKFKEFVSGDHTTVVPNADYFGEKAKVDAVIFKQVSDLNTQVAQVLTGELDIAFPEVQHLDRLANASNLEIRFNTPIQYFFIGLNNRLELFKDQRVRHALAYAIDRQAILESVVQGKAILATGPIHPAIKWAYNPNVKTYGYDEAMANQLLDEAGWTVGADGIREKDGTKFSFTITSTSGNAVRQQIDTALQQYYKKVGVDTKLEFLEPNLFDQKFFSFEFDCMMHFSQLFPEPDLSNYFATGGRNNYFGYSNPEVDELLTAGRATTVQSERAEIYRKFQEILAEDLPIVFFFHPQEVGVVNKRVQNYPPLDFRNATLYLQQISLSPS